MRATDGDRVRGILIGLAAGDRNGGPIRMALRLAGSLVDRRCFDSEDVLGRYLRWWRDEGSDTGPVAAHVFDLVASGVPDREAVAQAHAVLGGRTAGCNPAHRSPPLAMAAFLDDKRLVELAIQEASLTHWDPLAGDVAAATVVLCRALVRGASWDVALLRAASERQAQTLAAFEGLTDGPLRSDGYAPEVLRAALAFVSENLGFETALQAALAFAGPANYCPVLVGAIAGARWGAAEIPATLVRGDLLRDVQRAAEALVESWP